MPEIEGLQFNISGDNTSADKSIDQIIAALETLEDKVAAINQISFKKFTNALGGINKSSSWDSAGKKVDKLRNQLVSLNKISFGKLSRSIAALGGGAYLPSAFVSALRAVSLIDLSEISSGLWELKDAAAGLSHTDLSRFTESLRELTSTRALRTLAGQLGAVSEEFVDIGRNLALGLVQGIQEGSAGLEALFRSTIVDPIIAAARAGWEIHSPSKLFIRFGNWIAQGLGIGLQKGSNAPLSALERLTARMIALSQSAAQQIVSPYAKMGTVLSGLAFSGVRAALLGLVSSFKNLPAAATKFKNIAVSGLSKVTGAFNSVKSVASSFCGVLGRVAQVAGAGLASINVLPLIKKLGSVSGVMAGLLPITKRTSKAFLKFATTPIRSLVGPLKAIRGAMSNIGRVAGTVLAYSGFYRLISLISDALKTGTDNLYQYSKMMGGTFANSMDRMASSLQYFKNSVGAAVSPLLNALAPALDFVIDKVVALLNKFNQLMAALTGKSTYTQAVKQNIEYAESAIEAADAAEKLQRSLTAFDEINALTNNDFDSSANKTDTPDYGSMFTEVTVGSGISDFANQLREMVSNGDWQGVGTEIATRLNESIASVDWDGLGTNVGQKMQNAISLAYGFVHNFDFSAAGADIARLINNSLSQIDTEMLGRTLTEAFTGLLDFVLNFISTLDWGLLGRKVHDLIIGSFDSMTTWFQETDWEALADTLYQNFKQLIEGLDFVDIAKSFFELLGAALKAAVTVIGTIVGDIWDDIVSYFQLGLPSSDEIFGGFTGIADGIVTAVENIRDAVSGLYNDHMKPLFDALGSGFSTIFTNLSEGFSTYLAPVLDGLGDKFQNLLDGPLGDMLASLGNTFGALIDAITALWEGVLAPFFTWVSENIMPILSPIIDFIGTVVINAIGIVVETIGNLLDILTGIIDFLVGVFTGDWSKAWDGITEIFSGTVEGIVGIASGIGDTLLTLVGDFFGLLGGVMEGARTGMIEGLTWLVGNFVDTVKDGGTGMLNFVTDLFSGIATVAKYAWDGLSSSAKSVWNDLSSSAASTFGKIKDVIWEKMCAAVNAVADAIQRIKDLFSFDWGAKGVSTQSVSSLGSSRASSFSVGGYATGGLPDVGEMYVAREGGRNEMIGRMGSSSAVANNQQIVSGIAEGVASANSEQNRLLREQNALLRELLDKDTTVEVSTKTYTGALKRQNRRVGKTIVPVGT